MDGLPQATAVTQSRATTCGTAKSGPLAHGLMVSLGVILVYAISGLSANTQYQVRVRAVNSVGNGPWLSTTFTTTVFVAGWDIRRNGAELIGANVLPGVSASRGNAAGRTGMVPRAGHLAFVTDTERVELLVTQSN